MLLLIGLSVSSCVTTPPDVQICVRKPFNEGGRCNNTITENPYDMPESEYKDQEVGQFYLSPEAYGKIKKFIKEICLRTNKCKNGLVENRINYLEEYYGF